MLRRKYVLLRKIAFLLGCYMIVEALLPTAVWAITGHESMPEYRSFEPVTTTNMVNVFDGSFTYNIPILEIPNGYPLSLSYHSNDVNTEAQASWVGLGWTLNPGAINRIKRGFPDDYYKEQVTYHNKMPVNWTVSAGVGGGLETFGTEGTLLESDIAAGVDLQATLRYNNYSGFGTAYSGGITGPVGVASLNFSYSQGKLGFSPSLNPSQAFFRLTQERVKSSTVSDRIEKKAEVVAKKIEENDPKTQKANVAQITSAINSSPASPQVSMSIGGLGYSASGQGSAFSLAPTTPTSFPVSISPYTGLSTKLKLNTGINWTPAPIDAEVEVFGSYVQQRQDSIQQVDVYGYLHNEVAYGDEDAMMDYFTENEKPFEKREKYLGVPLPNNDIFNVSGEALGGTFRAHRAEFGHYRKNFVKSETYSVNAGVDINLASVATAAPPGGTNLVYTLGGNLGGDYQKVESGNWDPDYLDGISAYHFSGTDSFPESNEPYFFRFSGEKAGNFNLALDTTPVAAFLNGDAITPSLSMALFTGDQAIEDRDDNRRTTYIGHTLNEEANETHNEYNYNNYQTELHYLTDVDSPMVSVAYDYDTARTKTLEEFTTYNADGVRYVYGLPVYTREEKQMQYSLIEGTDYNSNDLSGPEGGLLVQVTSDIHDNAARRIGYESDAPYATTHLLTQINSPDYIDRTMDGPTPDDFGSYTRFNYEMVAGADADWYPYRTPYKKVSFNRGSLSDDRDDMGSFNYGEKELYYLHSISSKTHVAVFTLEDRIDGLSPPLDNDPDMDDLIKGSDGTDEMALKMLTRIDLYSIKDCYEDTASNIYAPLSDAIPIKTVRFEYDYSLCEELPNNQHTIDDSPADNRGKLTLRKVWFEYEGRLTSKISPYTFNYYYPITDYPSPYQALDTGYSNMDSTVQNPDYNPADTDRWGNYRNFSNVEDSLDTLSKFFPFVHQNPDTLLFDPAAWCLKNIELPSGGAIHVQYEQNDYQYVQNKRAMVMVPLADVTDNAESKGKKYYLDIQKAGIELGAIPNETLRVMFAPIIVNEDQSARRMFFHFFYGLLGDPSLDEYNSEYIEGFARIAGYGWEPLIVGNDTIIYPYVVFKKDASVAYPNFIPITYFDKVSKRELPRTVCKDYYNANRRGMLGDAVDQLSSGDAESRVKGLANMMGSALTPNLLVCKQMRPDWSYVRLQTPTAKKGGGVRVKRLLMYDPGMGGGDPATLYGNAYSYTALDEAGNTISSGVATNEPAIGRRESPLVNPIDRSEQSKGEAILRGRDMYSEEGPIGESLLPGPSVGYSRVTIRSIHDGRTATGFEEHEFYTCKEHPFKMVTPTTIQIRGDRPLSFGVGGPIGGSYRQHNPQLAQGYAFVKNEMHGQPKRVAKFPHWEPDSNLPKPDPLANEFYEYFAPGEQVSVIDEERQITTANIGIESEILSEVRQVKDVMSGGSLQGDISAGALLLAGPPFVIPVAIPTLKSLNFYQNRQILRTHVTTKIISYPAILKKVTNLADGVYHVTENEVFDKYTGQPVIVRSYDDFNENYFNQDIMASWDYSNMRSKAINEKTVATGVTYYNTGQAIYLDFTSVNSCEELEKFARGDLIKVDNGSSFALYHVDDVGYGGTRVYLQLSGMSSSALSGSGITVSTEVIRSGYTNQLNVKSGNFMVHGPNYFVPEEASSSAQTARQTLVSKLNTALTNAYNDQGHYKTIARTHFTSDAELIDPTTGQCLEPDSTFQVDLSLMVDNGVLYLAVADSSSIGTEPHYADRPEVVAEAADAVTTLNSMLDDFWGDTMDDTNHHPECSEDKDYTNNGYEIRWHDLPFDTNLVSTSPLVIDTFMSGCNCDTTGHDTAAWLKGTYELWNVNTLTTTYLDDNFQFIGGDNNTNPLSDLIVIPDNKILVSRCARQAWNKTGMGANDVMNPYIEIGCGWGSLPATPNQTTNGIGFRLDIANQGMPKLVCHDSTYLPAYPDSMACDSIDRIQPPGYCGTDSTYSSLRVAVSLDDTVPNDTVFSYKLVVQNDDDDCNLSDFFTADFTDRIGSFQVNSEGYLIFQMADQEDLLNNICPSTNHACGSSIQKYYSPGSNNNYLLSPDTFLAAHPEYFGALKFCNIQFYRYIDTIGGDICGELNMAPTGAGQFVVDATTGDIVYESETGTCFPQSVNCLAGCHDPVSARVVAASAVTFDDDWDYSDLEDLYYPDSNFDGDDYEKGYKGKWRPKEQYVYREALDDQLDATQDEEYRNYDRGTFAFVPFRYGGNNNQTKWVLTSTTTAYTPNGDPVEDQNILNIKSTAQYGYDHTLPILVAQNAPQNTVSFESFESTYPVGVDDHFENRVPYSSTYGVVSTNYPHTGTQSIELKDPGSSNAFIVGLMTVSAQAISEGALVRAWMRVDKSMPDPEDYLEVWYRQEGSSWSATTLPMYKVSGAGEWMLYEAYLTADHLSAYSGLDVLEIGIHTDFSSAGYSQGDIYLDDVRIQPMQSEMVCYVYDDAQRLTAVLDDQHYAMIYEYNTEGVLVRKLKETTRGVKTISETQYNTKGEQRQ